MSDAKKAQPDEVSKLDKILLIQRIWKMKKNIQKSRKNLMTKSNKLLFKTIKEETEGP
jgi:hypothetical protein